MATKFVPVATHEYNPSKNKRKIGTNIQLVTILSNTISRITKNHFIWKLLIRIIKYETIKGKKSWFMNPLLLTKNDEKKLFKPLCKSHKGVVKQICKL
jgi:hypothetical protein